VTAAKSVKKKVKSAIEETSEEDVKPDTKATAKKKPTKVAQVTSADEEAEESEESDGKMKKTKRIAKVKAVSDSKQETKVKKKPKEKTKKEKSEAKKKFEDTESESEQKIVKPRKSTKKVQISSDENDTEPEEKAKPKKKKELKSKRKSEVCSTDAEAGDKKKESVKVKVTKSKRKQEAESETDSESEASETSDEEAQDYRKGRARQPKELTMDCFTGTSAETPVGTFLAQFKVVAKQNGWPKSQWAYELVAKLRGEARTLILPEEDSSVPTFAKVVAKLKRHFGGDDDPDVHESLLQSRRRKPKETIRELEQWMRVTGQRANPDVKNAETLDRMLKRPFIEALQDEEQRIWIKQSDAKNMSEAAKLAIRWEATHKSEQMRHLTRGEKSRVQILETTMDDGENEAAPARTLPKSKKQQVDNVQKMSMVGGAAKLSGPTAPRYQPPARPLPLAEPQRDREQWAAPRVCYQCQQQGHLASECPSCVLELSLERSHCS
jgi:hypothetical protein